MIADKNKEISKHTAPFYLWLKIRENEQHTNVLAKYTKQFIATQLNTKDVYENRIGRYSLLIYKTTCANSPLNKLSTKFYTIVYKKLQTNLVNGDSLSDLNLTKRVWYKYMFT